MTSRITLLARVPDGRGSFPFVQVEFDENGQPMPPQGATSYYMRFRDGGARYTEPLGSDLNEAFARYQEKIEGRVYNRGGVSISSDAMIRIRRFLWFHHGHTGLYGDDGEMQCGTCGKDFKRDGIEALLDAVERAWAEQSSVSHTVSQCTPK